MPTAAVVCEVKSHTVKKGDTLWDLARKHGHKKWQEIWEHPDNARLRKERSTPEMIRPGDVIVIPPTQAERDKAAKELDRQVRTLDDALKLRDRAKAHMGEAAKALAALEKMVAKAQKAKAADEKELAKINKEIDRLDTLITDATGACSDMYSCVGAGSYIMKVEREVRELRKQAGAKRKTASDQQKALDSMAKLIKRSKSLIRDDEKTLETTSRAIEQSLREIDEQLCTLR